MAQGGGSQAATVAAEQASQQPGNSLLQHRNFRHEADAGNQEQPERILGNFAPADFFSFLLCFIGNKIGPWIWTFQFIDMP